MKNRKEHKDVKTRVICVLGALGLYVAMRTEFCGAVFGVLFAGVGILALWWLRRGVGIVHKGMMLYVGVVLSAMGTGMIVTSLGSALVGWREDVDFGILGLGVGVLLLLVPPIDIYKMLVCKEGIVANCVYVMTTRARYVGELYSPIYEFEWEGKVYRTQSGKVYTRRKRKCLGVGKKYYIYMNPKNPMMCCEERRLSFLSVFACVMGVILVDVGLGQIFSGAW